MDKVTFSNRLNRMLNDRKPKKIKKIELANAIPVTAQTVSRWCNGVLIPDKKTIILIVDKINQLYGYDQEDFERYRWEYLACEDNIPTYEHMSELLGFSLERRKMHKEFEKHFATILYPYMENIGFSPNEIINEKHFLKYIRLQLENNIHFYLKNLNPNTEKWKDSHVADGDVLKIFES